MTIRRPGLTYVKADGFRQTFEFGRIQAMFEGKDWMILTGRPPSEFREMLFEFRLPFVERHPDSESLASWRSRGFAPKQSSGSLVFWGKD